MIVSELLYLSHPHFFLVHPSLEQCLSQLHFSLVLNILEKFMKKKELEERESGSVKRSMRYIFTILKYMKQY
jgi:hypothetical protein